MGEWMARDGGWTGGKALGQGGHGKIRRQHRSGARCSSAEGQSSVSACTDTCTLGARTRWNLGYLRRLISNGNLHAAKGGDEEETEQ